MTNESKAGNPRKLQSRRKCNDLTIEIVQGAEMAEEQMDAIAHLLFVWWRREYEARIGNSGHEPL